MLISNSNAFFQYISCYVQLIEGNKEQAVQKFETLENHLTEDLPIQATGLWLKAKLSLPFHEDDWACIRKIEEAWKTPAENVLGGQSDIYTSNLAIYYAALLVVKNEYGKPELQKTLIMIRDYVFDHLIKDGSLVSSMQHKQPEVDIILAVLPFGLFAPEDLIVVSAVQHLLSADNELNDNIGNGLLGIYFIEKYDFEKAEFYQHALKDFHTENEKILSFLLSSYIQQKKQSISDVPFIHKPLGNGNVYDELPYERSPHYPQHNECCQFNVQVNLPDVQQVCLHIDGIGEEIPCELLNRDLNIYQAKFNVPNTFTGGEYYFIGKNKEKVIPSKKYQLRIKKVEEATIFNFLGQSERANVYQTNMDNFFILLGENKIEFRGQCPEIIAATVSNDCFRLNEESRAIVDRHNTAIFYLAEHPLTIESLLAEGIRRVKFSLIDEAKMYTGFGERYNTVNQIGQELDCFVYNQYRDQGTKTYMPMPVYYTDAGYGLFVDTDFYTKFDLQKSQKNVVSVSIDCALSEAEGKVDIILLQGTLKEMVQQFIRKTGKPQLIPVWALGPWMSSNNWDRDSIVRNQIALTNQYQIPSTVIVLEQWSDETTYYMFNDAEYELLAPGEVHNYHQMTFPKWGRWPDPKALVDYCHEKNLKLLLWQIPIEKYLNQQSHPLKDQDEAFMIEKGYVVKNKDNSPYRIPENWFTDSLLLDFTNQEAKEWWFKKRQYLIDIGVDGFKTDGGEMVYGDDVQFADGSTGRQMRNRYPNEYIQAYYEFAQQNEGITFSRAGYVGAQTFPAHWAGDERSTFAAFKRSLIAGINAGFSGVVFWGWDLAGFNGDIPTAELFKRSAAMAAFCPIMQYHAESKGEFNQDRTPWNIAQRTNDAAVIDVYRYFANVRMSLLPYVYDQSLKSCENYLPFMRSLQLEYPNEGFEDTFDEYMFGESLLIAPVIEEGASSREVKLPKGRWIDFWNHEGYEGNQTILASADTSEIPVYIKENSAILLNLPASGKLGDSIGNRTDCYCRLKLLVTVSQPFVQTIKDYLGNQIKVKVFEKNGEWTAEVSGIYEKVDIELIEG